jgi:hypothetical protein
MIFDQAFISKLGTKSLSKNPELTKERVNAAWNAATKEKQQEVYDLANVEYSTAYRVRSIGTITTKMTIAYSQALDLDPYFLIGATDENTGYTYTSAKKLLIEECKLKKAVIEFEKAYTPPKTDPPSAKTETAETVSETKSAYSTAGAIQKLNEDDLLGLFKALIIKAGVGKPEALEDMTKITEILMK